MCIRDRSIAPSCFASKTVSDVRLYAENFNITDDINLNYDDAITRASAALLAQRTMTVSYTHLDVYKRQFVTYEKLPKT